MGSRRPSTELPHASYVHSGDAPSVIEGLMESILYRRRMDQQQASNVPASMSQRSLAPSDSPPPNRRTLSRHSDVSAVLARSAAVRGDAGGVVPLSSGVGEFLFCEAQAPLPRTTQQSQNYTEGWKFSIVSCMYVEIEGLAL
jgi:hypothetical protein